MKIGIFDSGIGGLSVLHQALKIMPEHQYIYYADEKNVPYGEKTKEQVIGYVDEIIQFMIDHGVEAIVIACNTATSAAVKIMREKYTIPIIGMEPAVKKAIDLYGDYRVLVCATPITVNGKKMHDLVDRVDKKNLVDLVALPQLVRFAEKQEFDSEAVKNYLKEELSCFDLSQYHSLVLGCTHFNYFKDSFRAVLPLQIHFVDGNLGTLNHLKEYINANSLLPGVEYYYSGQKVEGKELMRIQAYLDRLDRMINIE
ncbi:MULTISPECIES: glutamate racemase [Coprobacillaceae]|uniref:glutamate racemase n=1 Tax=Coprobacillaceae TaxID=2810280 RepID=UPI000E4FE2F5|nr:MULTISPECIES: glutamate racemase [Coprobacillaceae]RHM60618.1 glutamate racemase [Coprobacillus sp. AF33-1AC]RHS93276.1 glutamate racemase [Erysipelatoclostridium sp. AM42-17]